jgi:sulfite dehydrogenase (quinone) subunit SoeA
MTIDDTTHQNKPSRRDFHKLGVASVGAYLAHKSGLLGGSVFESVQAATHTPASEEWVSSACWVGKQDCGILARRVNGRIVKVEGHPGHPRNRGTLCPKGVAQVYDIYDPGRVKRPLIRVNAKGQPGGWREASWDEALDLVATRFQEAIAEDSRKAAWIRGRMKWGAVYDTVPDSVMGIARYGRRGNDCGGAAQDSTLATWGIRSHIAPDLRHCRYLICYWNLTQAGGPAMCNITYPQMVQEARRRGMKVISIDPYNRPVADYADEWVPIKPGTDMAFWLAVLRELLAAGYVDSPFLTRHTNAPALVRDDGSVVRNEAGEVLVWDSVTEYAVPYDQAVAPALLGTYSVDGAPARPALQRLKDHVGGYTPEWASGVCGIPAPQIRAIALALGENANIGSTITLDGVTLPYRPVAYGIHGTATKFHASVQTNRAIHLSFLILGAIEAVGGPHLWSKRTGNPYEQHARWVANAARTNTDRLDLHNTSHFPMGAGGYLQFPFTLNDPETYGLPYPPEEMVALTHHVNPVLTNRPVEKAISGWSRFGFLVSVTPDLNATADYCADVVLPCGTLDKWEGPLNVRTLYDSAQALRVPVSAPLGESRGEMEIYADLCERMGLLTGEGGFIDEVNKSMGLSETHSLPLDTKPTVEQLLEAWTQDKHGMTLDEFKDRRVVGKPIPVEQIYLSAGDEPYGGTRAALYIEAFDQVRETMQANGAPASLSHFWTALPTWSDMPMEASPAEFDLYMTDCKRIEHKQSRSGNNPILRELMGDNPLVMNTKTARAKGLDEGDMVWVESHNPVTGETRRLQTRLTTVEGIRPDSVLLTHHVHNREEPNVNELFDYGEGFWDMGGSWFSHIKVRVWKEGIV